MAGLVRPSTPSLLSLSKTRMPGTSPGMTSTHFCVVASRPAAALAARDLGGQGFEAVLPKSSELVEPRVDLLQRPGIDRVNPLRARHPHRREAAVAQHLQVLRHSRLRDAELALNHRNDVAGAMLPISEQFQNAPPDRVA